jgi:hypothetical protein
VSAMTSSYDGRRFAPAGTALTPGGALAAWSQDGDTVTARFAGGPLRTGFLVGTVGDGGVVDAAYCQVLADGTVQAGRCLSTPEHLPDGRLRLREEWRRTDGDAGVSLIDEVIEEILP